MFDETAPIFQQLADAIAEDILRGVYGEGDQVPSINELAVLHRINPATANRAVAMLVDQGVLVKRRGIGMFVADGGLELIRSQRRADFAAKYVKPLIAEANVLGLDSDALIAMLRKENPS